MYSESPSLYILISAAIFINTVITLVFHSLGLHCIKFITVLTILYHSLQDSSLFFFSFLSVRLFGQTIHKFLICI